MPNTRRVIMAWLGGSIDRFGFNSTNFEVRAGGVAESVATNLQWAALAPLTVRVNKPGNVVTLSGFLAGNGDHAITTAVAPFQAAGQFTYGSQNTSFEFNGALSCSLGG
jgi:hypothetical protein